MNLYFMKYNNYYNRIIKKLDTINDYYNTYNAIIKENVNFNPNDNVNTTLTVNWDRNWTPDYLLVEDPNNNTFTRWFVLDAMRLRGQQYQMTLRHDLVADNLENILEADCFIEKAILDNDDPLIYNNENMTVNQIKTNEYLLKDESECAWICGYYGDSFNVENDIMMTGKFNIDIAFDKPINMSFNEWLAANNNIKYADRYTIISSLQDMYAGKSAPETMTVYTSQFDLSGLHLYNKAVVENRAAANTLIRNKISTIGGSITNQYAIISSMVNTRFQPHPSAATIDNLFYSNKELIVNKLKDYTPFITKEEANSNILSLNNKIVKFISSNGSVEYYKLKITYEEADNYWTNAYTGNKNSLCEVLNDTCNFKYYGNANTVNSETAFVVGALLYNIKITGELQKTGEYTLSIHQGRDKLIDAPYRMFCLPYKPNEKIIYKNTSDGTIIQDSDIGLKMATALSKAYSGANQIYDIQILPYCPMPLDIFKKDSQGTYIDFNNVESSMYDVITYKERIDSTPINAGFVFYPTHSSFTVDIPFNKFVLSNIKLSNETDIMRLVSPNYNGQFEFKPSKNIGISGFNADCTYLPYQPYIHVNPNFSGLYGIDFNDTRGLICCGDFSIAQINDAWSTYQIQNKNYENIFNREIQSLELKYKYERTTDIVSGMTGILQGGISGGMAGASGGVAGIIAGAAIGTASSTVGFGMDYQIKEALRNDALDYKNDMFGYHLGNIQALPQSISKTTAFTYNNKYFPILEYYTCTEKEKEAVANKIAYNSMTVMTIGKLKDYINNKWSYKNIESKGYIKGSIIRMENFTDDFHILNTISEEIYKGVYLQ